MTMPVSEPSPHILIERSASFNRAEFNKSMRTKASYTDSTGDVEFTENLKRTQSSIRHIRHSSLDSPHPSALHPINLNAKFDQLLSPLCLAKPPAKVSVDQANKESSCLVDSDKQKEGGGETQEELILDPHESLLLDSQEESFSPSMSAESKSPRRDADFILWGNAAFCLSPMRSKGLGLHRQTERSFGESITKQSYLSNGKHQLSTDEVSSSLASDRSLLPHKTVVDDDYLASATNHGSNRLADEVPGAEEAEISLTRQSSVGSTLSVQESSTQRHTQAHDCAESSTQNALMSPEVQSCSLDFDAEDMEASAASDDKMPHDKPQEKENLSKESTEEENNEEVEMDVCSQQASQSGGLSPQVDGEAQQDSSVACEEVKIRAELELEIERDLEEEIRTKIYLLSRRLEELQVLKATRRPKHELTGIEIEVGSCIASIEKEKENILRKAMREPSLLKSPPSKSPKKRATIEECKIGAQVEMTMRASSAPAKEQLSNAEEDGLATHANNPFANLRKFVVASGWAPHTKENTAHLPPSRSHLRNMKIQKTSIEGLPPLKPKFQVDNTPDFKQDYQNWMVNTQSKKFDWMRTLRSDVPCTPRLSSTKANGEHNSPFLPPSKESLGGHVARHLFSEDSSLAPPKKTLAKIERRESLMTPLAGSLKRSPFSSSKPNGDLVASAPRVHNTSSGILTHDNAIKSAATKRDTSQKPSVGIHNPSPAHKTPDLKQTRIATPSNPRFPPSSRHGKTEKTSIVEPLTSPTRSLKTSSPTHAEKAKRSASAPPSVPARSASKIASSKALPNKQVSSLPQTRASRTAPSLKPATSSSLVSKGRIGVPADNVGKRPSATHSRPTGASTKGKWY